MDEEIDNTEKGREGERFVNEIAFNSFLRYWCYPGPMDIAGDNKEICDLLIVFHTACIIVSVKNYSFKGNYERYFRSTTERAMRQILGAERNLFRDSLVLLKHPDRIEEVFDRNSIKHIYRIVVNLNPAVKVYQTSFFKKDKEFIVMDIDAWASAVVELSTLPDLLNYINERLRLTNKGPAIMLSREEMDFSQPDGEYLAKLMLEAKDNLTTISGSELDLIATYYKNGFQFPAGLLDPKFNARSLKIDGEWTKFRTSSAYEKKLELERAGGFVDEIVRELIIDKKNGENLSRLLFSMNKMHRAVLSKHFDEFYTKQKATEVGQRPYYYARMNPKMVFLYFNDDYSETDLQNRITVYLMHMSYLFNYAIEEIGLIGKSKSGDKYAFGYTTNKEVPNESELKEFEKFFANLNLRLRSEVSPSELANVPFADDPFFKSPF